ncbi:uncharacterized oxidoreductase MexAM1_META1p0182-like [Haliotis cracherodii]|uniref:uncharacterized oxidoreductase MexAM1_META1p0182-like n=1 Tax=Haliotis cracherodii TaxID=6455 RepID=UPI0039E81BCD
MALGGKVAIITGSSSGIGAGIAAVFAKEGAKLSLTGRNQKNLEEVAKNCKTKCSADVLITAGDITDAAFRKTLVEATKKKFGKIDILVNNAGISMLGPLRAAPKEQYEKQMAVNVEAPVFLTQLVLPYLIETKGCVVNTSTAGTKTITPNGGFYVMSKAALETFTRYLAQEMASQGVRVNAVLPGYVPSRLMSGQMDSAMVDKLMIKATPIGRRGTPEEMGQIVAFLASEKAAFITGECILADGGISMTTPDIST